MDILIRDLTGDAVCAGAQTGREIFGRLLALTVAEPIDPEPVFLDFAGVTVATVSFLRESVLAFREFVRGRKSNYYPVIANVNAAVSEEMEVILLLRGEAFLCCDLESDRIVHNVTLLGRLEGKQQRAFQLVTERGETDATELQLEFGAAEGIQQTAWNNRLSGLAAAGIVVEVSRGRAKRYRSLLKGA